MPCLSWAQDDVWYLDINSPQSFVLSGQTLQLELRATTAAGAPAAAVTPEWRSSNSLIAEVDAAGRVRGLLPGEAIIEAAHNGLTARLTIRVQPTRIEIQPATVDLEVGQQRALSAQALDAAGDPLPGLRFLWASGVSQVASVDGAGNVTAHAEGSVTISALLDIPDLGSGFSAQTRVRVRRRAPFRASRLVSSDLQSSPVTLRRIESQSSAGDRTAFTAALSNGSGALLLWENGRLRPLSFAGDFFEPTGQVINGFSSVSLNARGEVVAAVNFATWPNTRLVRFPASGPPELVPLPSEYLGWGALTPRSLGNEGELLFLAWNNRGQNLLFLRPDGRLDRVATQGDQLPGFGAVSWFGDLLPPVAGKAAFLVGGPNRTGIFEWDGRNIRKLLATGDAVLGRTVTWLDSPLQSASGDLYLRVGGDSFHQVVRYSGGAWSNVVQAGQPVTNGATVQWIDGLRDVRGSTLAFSGGSDRGNGLFRLESGNLELLARYGNSAENDEYRWFEHAALDARGGAFVRGPQGNIVFRLARVGGGASVTLTQFGRPLDTPVPNGPLSADPVGGANAGVPVFVSFTRSLMRAEPDRLESLLAPGDPLPGNEILQWIGAIASNRNGDFAFRAGSARFEALYLWRNGRLSRVTQNSEETRLPTGQRLRWFGWSLAVNNRGQVVCDAGFDGGSGLFLFAEGAPIQTIALSGGAAPGGGSFLGFPQPAIDELGRVAFYADVAPGRRALFYWESGQIRRIRQAGDPGPGGLAQSGFDGPLRAAGDKIYAFFNYPGQSEIAAYDGVAWRAAVSGAPLCSSSFSVSSAGDVLHYACLPDGSGGPVLRKPDGRDIVVAATGQRSAAGDWYYQFLQWTLSEQGEVFFTALTPAGPRERVTLFRAAPQ